MKSLGLFLFAVCVVCVTCSQDRPVVQTKYGKVAGTKSSNFDGTKYYAFRGIPYAKPPVEDLRYQRPVPPEPWTDLKDASTEASQCLQFDPITSTYTGTEDCLFVNVYVPEVPESLRGKEKPVMVYIHGGGFFSGSGNGDLYGPGKLMDYDVILVTLNYRLGIFGFLSTGDDNLPGNYGMWDQVLALKWVQQNIKAFGGDPNKVTIFGESSGAGGTSHHLISPASKGLFNRAILMSGSSLCPWAIQEDPLTNARIIAAKLNCPTESGLQIGECLRKKTTKELFTAFIEYSRANEFTYTFYFAPVIDSDDDDSDDNDKGSFMPEHPEVMLKKKQFNNVPVMMGVVDNEGAIINQLNVREYKFDKYFYDKLFDSYVDIMSDVGKKNLKKTAEKLKKKYFSKVTDFNDQSQTTAPLHVLLTDILFHVDVTRMASILATQKSTETYFYLLKYRGKHSVSDMFTKEDHGATHMDDLQYIFDTNLCGSDGKLEGKDKEVSRQMLSFWTNFSKTGNPTPNDSSDSVDWDPLGENDFNYIEIGNKLQMRKDFDADIVKFWDSLRIRAGDKLNNRDEL